MTTLEGSSKRLCGLALGAKPKSLEETQRPRQAKSTQALYCRLQKVGIWMWDDSCWFFLGSFLLGSANGHIPTFWLLLGLRNDQD